MYNVRAYIAALSQSGTGAPTQKIIANGLRIEPVWTRVGAGQYRATFTGVTMVRARTQIRILGGYEDYTITGNWNTGDSIQINTELAGTMADSCLFETIIEVLEYLEN